MEILLIDDDEMYAGLFIDIINNGCEKLAWNITHIDNFPEAQEIAHSDSNIFDAVFSDTELGNGFKGYDLLPYFINKGYFSVLMSGQDYSKEAEQIGCPFFPKVHGEEIINMINQFHNDIIEFNEKNMPL